MRMLLSRDVRGDMRNIGHGERWTAWATIDTCAVENEAHDAIRFEQEEIMIQDIYVLDPSVDQAFNKREMGVRWRSKNDVRWHTAWLCKPLTELGFQKVDTAHAS
jgi:hypothetical protein